MTITMRDVAQQAGVSIKTVSRVINQEGEISEETRHRVLKVVADLGYRPNMVARGLVTRRTGIVGLIIPDITNPFFAEMTRGIHEVVRDQDLSLMICSADESVEFENRALRSMIAQHVDGILFFPSLVSGYTMPAFLKAMDGHTPIVSFNGYIKDERISQVIIDVFEGARQIVHHFVENGHTKIGMLAPLIAEGQFPRRLLGYRAALAEHGLPADPGWVTHSPSTISAGYESARDLLNKHPEITAIFCYNDLMAIGALRACRDARLRVPEDIAIAGYDNIELAQAVAPALTTIHIDKRKLGQRAMQMLIDRIRFPDHPAQRETMAATLIVRESSRMLTPEHA